jgi:hypothetical protein
LTFPLSGVLDLQKKPRKRLTSGHFLLYIEPLIRLKFFNAKALSVMSDIEKIRVIEDEQQALIDKEHQNARERINRAESDASFRVGQILKEKKGIIDGLVKKGTEDAAKEVAHLREQNTVATEELLAHESQSVDRAVEFVLKQILG